MLLILLCCTSYSQLINILLSSAWSQNQQQTKQLCQPNNYTKQISLCNKIRVVKMHHTFSDLNLRFFDYLPHFIAFLYQSTLFYQICIKRVSLTAEAAHYN